MVKFYLKVFYKYFFRLFLDTIDPFLVPKKVSKSQIIKYTVKCLVEYPYDLSMNKSTRLAKTFQQFGFSTLSRQTNRQVE